MTDDPPIQVFVHMPAEFDAQRWHQSWQRGEVVGINEPYPYGFHRAGEMGCAVTFSASSEGRVRRLLRLGLRAVLGFDLVHAWRNRAAIGRADVVWTHTESQGLGVLATLALARVRARPAVLLGSVWLVDRWQRYPAGQRWLFRRLLRRADRLTFSNGLARDAAARLFPEVPGVVIPFGIRAEGMLAPRAPSEQPRLLAVGNDEGRDWQTAVEAVELVPGARLQVASRTFPAQLRSRPAVEAVHATSHEQLEGLYAAADVMVLAVRPNVYASGITTLEEAVHFGLPVIASDTGGLGEYFDDTMVTFVPPGDPAAIAAAVCRLAEDPERARTMAQRAQERTSSAGICSESYVRRHVELSREVLGR